MLWLWEAGGGEEAGAAAEQNYIGDRDGHLISVLHWTLDENTGQHLDYYGTSTKRASPSCTSSSAGGCCTSVAGLNVQFVVHFVTLYIECRVLVSPVAIQGPRAAAPANAN